MQIFGSGDKSLAWQEIWLALDYGVSALPKLQEFYNNFDYINSHVMEIIAPIIGNPEMKPELILRYSYAASKLMEWILCLVEITRAKGH
jgi:hypothetical protein